MDIHDKLSQSDDKSCNSDQGSPSLHQISYFAPIHPYARACTQVRCPACAGLNGGFMKPVSEQVLSRRKALAGAGAVGAVAAVAAVASTGLTQAPEQVASAQPEPANPDQAGYRLTEHIKRYYSTARV
jgi:hypothetical protein